MISDEQNDMEMLDEDDEKVINDLSSWKDKFPILAKQFNSQINDFSDASKKDKVKQFHQIFAQNVVIAEAFMEYSQEFSMLKSFFESLIVKLYSTQLKQKAIHVHGHLTALYQVVVEEDFYSLNVFTVLKNGIDVLRNFHQLETEFQLSNFYSFVISKYKAHPDDLNIWKEIITIYDELIKIIPIIRDFYNWRSDTDSSALINRVAQDMFEYITNNLLGFLRNIESQKYLFDDRKDKLVSLYKEMRIAKNTGQDFTLDQYLKGAYQNYVYGWSKNSDMQNKLKTIHQEIADNKITLNGFSLLPQSLVSTNATPVLNSTPVLTPEPALAPILASTVIPTPDPRDQKIAQLENKVAELERKTSKLLSVFETIDQIIDQNPDQAKQIIKKVGLEIQNLHAQERQQNTALASSMINPYPSNSHRGPGSL